MTVINLTADQHRHNVTLIRPSAKAAKSGVHPKTLKAFSRPNVARRHPLAPASKPVQPSRPITLSAAKVPARAAVDERTQLSDRSLAAIMIAFVCLMVIAGAVLLTQFISITAPTKPSSDVAVEAVAAVAPGLTTGR